MRVQRVVTQATAIPKLHRAIRVQDGEMAKRQKRGKRGPRPMSDVDRRVAANVKRFRVDRDFTQERLAKVLGLSFQQLQKYETGKNRITIGRLVAICEALEVSLTEMVHGAR